MNELYIQSENIRADADTIGVSTKAYPQLNIGSVIKLRRGDSVVAEWVITRIDSERSAAYGERPASLIGLVHRPTCTWCNNEAITTVVQKLACREHDIQYQSRRRAGEQWSTIEASFERVMYIQKIGKAMQAELEQAQ